MKNLALVFILILSTWCSSAFAEERVGSFDSHPAWASLAPSLGVYVLFLSAEKNLQPENCRWCSPPHWESSLTHNLQWSLRSTADHLSTAIAYGILPAGLLSLMILEPSADKNWMRVAEDLAFIAEISAWAGSLVELTKTQFARERPAESKNFANQDYSFLSGHTTLAFTFASAAGTYAEMENLKAAPWIWAGGMGLAGLSAYLRLAAGEHFLTDVLASSAVGSAVGYAIPHLFHFRKKNLQVAPTASGLIFQLKF